MSMRCSTNGCERQDCIDPTHRRAHEIAREEYADDQACELGESIKDRFSIVIGWRAATISRLGDHSKDEMEDFEKPRRALILWLEE